MLTFNLYACSVYMLLSRTAVSISKACLPLRNEECVPYVLCTVKTGTPYPPRSTPDCCRTQKLLPSMTSYEASNSSLFAVRRLLKNPLEPERVQEIITEAVDIEKSFICDSLPVSHLLIN